MKHCTLLSLVVLLGLSSLGASAQPQRTKSESGAGSAGATKDQMAEDIEIMRRLLLRKLGRIAGRSQGMVVTGGGLGGGGFGMGGGGGGFGGGFGMGGGGGFSGGSSGGGGMLGSPGASSPDPFGNPLGEFGGFTGIGRAVYTESTTVEGAYLRNYGVVFSVSMPGMPRLAVTTPRPSPTKLSDWEEMQRLVRGEKSAPKSGSAQTPSVTDVILQTLAENGRHFTSLKPEEMITIFVTFRAASANRQVAVFGTRAADGDSTIRAGGGIFGGGGRRRAGGSGGGAGAPGGQPGGPGGGAGGAGGPGGAGNDVQPGGLGGGGLGGVGPDLSSPSTARDYELLADLHLKQGKAKEAIAAFKKALSMDVPIVADRLTLYHKLAQAYLAADEDTAAEKVLQTLSELRKKTGKLRNIAGEQRPSRQGPPPQLIITAHKALLDRVGSGQLSFDDFARLVSREVRGVESK